jgi:hypothetical protein
VALPGTLGDEPGPDLIGVPQMPPRERKRHLLPPVGADATDVPRDQRGIDHAAAIIA